MIRLFNVDEHSWRERLVDILKLAKDTNLQAYAQSNGSLMPKSVHLATPTKVTLLLHITPPVLPGRHRVK